MGILKLGRKTYHLALAQDHPFTSILLGSLSYKVLNICAQLLLVRITLSYLGQRDYGFWIVLSSVLTAFSVFDFGFGNGLRNKVTEAMTTNLYDEAKQYISTTYLVLSLIFGFVFVASSLTLPFVNLHALLNTYFLSTSTIYTITIATLGSFCVRLVANLISSIMLATHQAVSVEKISFFTNLLTLLLMICTSYLSLDFALPLTCFVYGFVPPIVLFFFSYHYFQIYSYLRPSFSSVNFSTLKTLGGLGVNFFFIQLASMIFVSAPNFMIVQLFNAEQVTVYSIVYRYMSLLIIFSNVLIAPFWSHIAESVYNNNLEKIRGIVEKLVKFWIVGLLIAVIMVVISNLVYDTWLGERVNNVSVVLTFMVALNVVINIWGTIFSTVLNALNLIRVQLYIVLIVTPLSIPLTIFLVRNLNLGLVGVPLATILCLLPGALIQPIQYMSVINRKTRGLWLK